MERGSNIPVIKRYVTCNGCRANEGRNNCSLGYLCKDYKPMEPCPKPKTIQALVTAPVYR